MRPSEHLFDDLPDPDAEIDPDLEAELDEDFPLGDGTAETEALVVCPYCGEENEIALDPGGGTLYALNEQTGAVAASISVGTAVRFATPALTGRLVLVPTQTGITAVNGA